MLIISNVTKVTQGEDLNPGLATSEARAHNCPSEDPLEDSDKTNSPLYLGRGSVLLLNVHMLSWMSP